MDRTSYQCNYVLIRDLSIFEVNRYIYTICTLCRAAVLAVSHRSA